MSGTPQKLPKGMRKYFTALTTFDGKNVFLKETAFEIRFFKNQRTVSTFAMHQATMACYA
jgi:hypothetical protein